ncbi:hypothetical protein B0T16DRAFT_417473 [Cercophora newfieldiana]|uniref:Uncharacterized protein n=1 Tax=Cercophora newfieldiana TaxID=92897 RepID=A0AA39Y207_9PEZI|nr:hypothetical protein B0T16DRAFT_417473 [Cercophora newfieldiana]
MAAGLRTLPLVSLPMVMSSQSYAEMPAALPDEDEAAVRYPSPWGSRGSECRGTARSRRHEQTGWSLSCPACC